MAWHNGSEYPHPTQRLALDRNARARWHHLVKQHRGAQRLTALDELVALELLHCLGNDGRCDPSHAYLARLARCCTRSIGYAIERLRGCGLLTWTRRIVWTKHGARQTSSAFRLNAGAAEPEPRPDRKRCRENQNSRTKRASPGTTEARAQAEAMLAELRPTKTLKEIAAERMAKLWGKPRMA